MNDSTCFDYQVRVLLADIDIHQNNSWSLSSTSGFLLQCHDDAKVWLYKKNNLEIACHGNQVFLNGKRVHTNCVYIRASDGLLSFDNKAYAGSFLLCRDEKKWHLINQLNLEDYVSSVLRSESWPGWPVEVNKAFAIASRSYVMHKIEHAKRTKRLYHIKNTNIHQTYRGVHNRKEILQAVDETKGIILTHNDKPIDAMFDSCCGGLIPSLVEGFDFTKAPYLARTYPCTFCKECSIYSWTHEFDVLEVEKMLQESCFSIKDLKHIHITKRDKAGTVQEVSIKDGLAKHSIILNGKQCYSLFKKIKSFCFTVKKKHTKFIFQGKGYGHHIGLCQWGAKHMVDKGYTYWEILNFFYPGVLAKKLI